MEICTMSVNYNKLWKILIDKKMKKTEFAKAIGIGQNTLAKLGRNDTVSMEVMVKICRFLDCNIGDVMDIEKENFS